MPAVGVNELRAEEDTDAILRELLDAGDNAMMVDCAGPDVKFIVKGWFVFPPGSLVAHPELTGPT